MPVKTTVDYANRLVDLELLQSVTEPSQDFQRVYPTFTRFTGEDYTVPKMVTGVEKAVQRYLKLLTTDIGSIHFAQDIGGELVVRTFNGSISSTAVLNHIFALANDTAITKMAEDDNDELFGDSPEDERIVSATLVSSTINPAAATISLMIDIEMESGSTYTYVVPVAVGLQ